MNDAPTLAHTREVLRREIGQPTDRDHKWQPLVSAREVRQLLDAIDALESGWAEHDRQVRAEAASRIRKLAMGHSDSNYINGYNEAVDLAARLAEDRHTVSECCNARCGSPIYNLHCFECDEIEQEYGVEHIREHADPADLARFDRPIPEGRRATGPAQLATYGLESVEAQLPLPEEQGRIMMREQQVDLPRLAHDFQGVSGHPDDDECTYREDGTDATYCGRPEADHG